MGGVFVMMIGFNPNNEGLYMKRFILTIFTLVLSTAIISAQENQCLVNQQAAVSEARVWCTNLTVGEACYGNSPLNADMLSDAPFNISGDIVPLTDITQISSSIDENRYGISLINTVSYSPDNWLAQDVSLAVLGDVTIANTGNEAINLVTVDAEISSELGANIRTGPTTEYRILTSLFAGDTVKLTGRFRDDTFYRLQLPSGLTGWIASSAVDADVNVLPFIAVDDSAPELIYAPFTAFSLRTASSDANCENTWESGVLVQSPSDIAIRIAVNDIPVVLSGTIFLQADELSTSVYVLDGNVNYADEVIGEGYQLLITDVDSVISPYEISRLAPLPTEILPRYTYIGIELATIITPAPTDHRSPIADVLVDAQCVLTTGDGGANFRSGPGSEFPIRGVLAFRETANPIGRVIGSDGLLWYELAQNIWVTSQVVVTGGDCIGVPQSQRIPVPLPTSTPEN